MKLKWFHWQNFGIRIFARRLAMWDKEWWCVIVTIAEGSELQWWPPVLLPGGLLPFWNWGHSTSPAEDAKDNGTRTPLMTHLETQKGHAIPSTLSMHAKSPFNWPPNPQKSSNDPQVYSEGLWPHYIKKDYVYPSGFICITTTPLTAYLSYRFVFLHFDKHKKQPCDDNVA